MAATDIESFHKAILAGDSLAVERALQVGLDHSIDEEDSNGFIAVALAARKPATTPILRQILKRGCKVDQKGEDRETALYTAVYNLNEDAVQLLLGAGAKVNETNGMFNETALHLAARLGSVELTKVLIGASANINARTSKMETPLFIAAKAGRVDVTFALLNFDANRATVNNEGKDALYIASECGHKGIVQILKADKKYLKETKSAVDAEQRMQKPKVQTTEEMVAKMERTASESVEDAEAEKLLMAKAKSKQQPASPTKASAKKPASPTSPKPAAKKTEAKHVEPETLIERGPMIPIEIPKPAVRTHDPFTGQPLPPCKTLAEVGPDEPAPQPKNVRGVDVPEVNYGGTAMVVGTGTEERIVQKEPVVEMMVTGGDREHSHVVMPGEKKKPAKK